MTPTRSPSARASSWSWVTNRVVVPTAIWIRRISSRSCARTLASRAESGSSSSRTLRLDGERSGERDPLLLAARHLMRVTVAPGRQAHELEQFVGPRRRARRPPPRDPQPVGDVVQRGHVREQAVGLEDDADVALVAGMRVMSLPSTRIRPESSSSSPASARSAVVFPQPEGPSRATSSPGAISSDSPSSAWTCRTSGAGRAAGPRPHRPRKAEGGTSQSSCGLLLGSAFGTLAVPREAAMMSGRRRRRATARPRLRRTRCACRAGR